jgi:hypothetical protein
MRGVTHNRPTEIHPMLIVDCPMCDGPVALHADEDALDCDACGVRVQIAEPDPIALSAAA